jgi:hypothetical protein
MPGFPSVMTEGIYLWLMTNLGNGTEKNYPFFQAVLLD